VCQFVRFYRRRRLCRQVRRDGPHHFVHGKRNTVGLTDTGHILNTGDWDFVFNVPYGGDGNESINWNVVGSQPVRGGTSVPEPGTLSLLGLGLAALGFTRRRKTV
jgi:hypothetical protein